MIEDVASEDNANNVRALVRKIRSDLKHLEQTEENVITAAIVKYANSARSEKKKLV